MTQGMKRIARATGLSGVEAENIAKALAKKNIGYDVVDWKTLGEDSKDFGSRTDTVWNKLGSMYGISRPMSQQQMRHEEEKAGQYHQEENIRKQRKWDDFQFEILFDHHSKRSPRSQAMDENIQARKICKINDLKCVQKWMKHPELYDIEGIDCFKGISKKRRR